MQCRPGIEDIGRNAIEEGTPVCDYAVNGS